MDISMTPREKEVASLLIRGFTNFEISQNLGISTHMIKIYVTNLLKKYKASNRTELAYIIGKNNVI